MKTYVAENVLTDWTSGLIVVKAKNKADAMEMVKKKLHMYDWHDCEMDHCESETCLRHRLRELKDNELVYVFGGG